MKEEHKLQIRVRSKTEQRMMEDIDVKMITEWDVKKIVITLCCLLLLIGIMYYFFANEESPEIANKRAKLEEVNKIASSLSQKKTVVVEK
jgi:Tfp pilus assembly protein PilO